MCMYTQTLFYHCQILIVSRFGLVSLLQSTFIILHLILLLDFNIYTLI